MAPDKLTIYIYPSGMTFEMLERKEPPPVLTLMDYSEDWIAPDAMEAVDEIINRCGPCGSPVLKRGQICKQCARKRGWR